MKAWVLLICAGNLCWAPASYDRLDECVPRGKGVAKIVATDITVECRHRDILVPAADGLRWWKVVR